MGVIDNDLRILSLFSIGNFDCSDNGGFSANK